MSERKPYAAPTATPGSPGEEMLEAILKSLYQERRRLIQAKRLGQFSSDEQEYLADLTQYIDHWESFEFRPRDGSDVWRRLEAIAGLLVSPQSAVELQVTPIACPACNGSGIHMTVRP